MGKNNQQQNQQNTANQQQQQQPPVVQQQDPVVDPVAAATNATIAALPPIAAPVVSAPAPAVIVADEDPYVEASPQTGLPVLTGIPANYIEQIRDYVVNMAPGRPIGLVEGARHQANLYRTIVSLINHSGDQFHTAFHTLLGLFHEHREGALQERMVFRFPEVVALNPDERETFQSLLNMLCATSNPGTREHTIKFIDLGKTFRRPTITEQSKQRIHSFYGK